MTNETAQALGPLEFRTHGQGAATPLDRISVRDYVRTVDIGAFGKERGVTQRVRFNVVLEVVAHAAAENDDVDQVISYDTIVEAIHAALAVERLNLLETLAERIAAGCLADARALRVFIRVEKLDRIPGALGVEIMRQRRPADTPRLGPVPAPRPDAPGARPLVLFLAAGAMPDRDQLAAMVRPLVVVLPPLDPSLRDVTGEAARRISLLSMEQAAWRFAGADDRLVVAGSRTELDWALREGFVAVWAPSKIVLDAVDDPAPDGADPAALATWLARHLDGEYATALPAA
ncbi:dihydroneopterin aldolase [Rubricella aquisinus]|uniref:dihydroneopterin aldolase n=1 Tax=Rubricella aquisinus TaxID=2028108 RepID=A0A840X312_9RHOB|nr:dihydroneopterin aldolase [Rubricella aquisinus]MBB5516226.1 dihydroneopterin aldolase [Rubricella aquisinus]